MCVCWQSTFISKIYIKTKACKLNSFFVWTNFLLDTITDLPIPAASMSHSLIQLRSNKNSINGNAFITSRTICKNIPMLRIICKCSRNGSRITRGNGENFFWTKVILCNLVREENVVFGKDCRFNWMNNFVTDNFILHPYFTATVIWHVHVYEVIVSNWANIYVCRLLSVYSIRLAEF